VAEHWKNQLVRGERDSITCWGKKKNKLFRVCEATTTNNWSGTIRYDTKSPLSSLISGAFLGPTIHTKGNWKSEYRNRRDLKPGYHYPQIDIHICKCIISSILIDWQVRTVRNFRYYIRLIGSGLSYLSGAWLPLYLMYNTSHCLSVIVNTLRGGAPIGQSFSRPVPHSFA